MPGKRQGAPQAGPAAKRSNAPGHASLQMQHVWAQIVYDKMMSMLHPSEGSVEIHPGQWALDQFGAAEAGALNRAVLRGACERLLGSPMPVLDDGLEFPNCRAAVGCVCPREDPRGRSSGSAEIQPMGELLP